MPRPKKRRPGRPSLGVDARTKPVIVKLSEREHAAIVEAVARENAEIESDASASAEDRKPATVSSWIRDHALEPIGLATFRSEDAP